MAAPHERVVYSIDPVEVPCPSCSRPLTAVCGALVCLSLTSDCDHRQPRLEVDDQGRRKPVTPFVPAAKAPRKTPARVTRARQHEQRQNARRYRLLETLHEQPGLTCQQLAKVSRESCTVTHTSLHELKLAGQVASERQGRRMVWSLVEESRAAG